MSHKLTGILGGVALAAALGGSAGAHHSFAAEFDVNQPVELVGEVAMFEWVNPHSWLHIDVTDPDTGEVVRWRVEGGAPSPLLRRGWTRDSLPAGTRVSVEGYRSRDGDTRANATDITFPDGSVMFFGSTGRGAPNVDDAEPAPDTPAAETPASSAVSADGLVAFETLLQAWLDAGDPTNRDLLVAGSLGETEALAAEVLAWAEGEASSEPE